MPVVIPNPFRAALVEVLGALTTATAYPVYITPDVITQPCYVIRGGSPWYRPHTLAGGTVAIEIVATVPLTVTADTLDTLSELAAALVNVWPQLELAEPTITGDADARMTTSATVLVEHHA